MSQIWADRQRRTNLLVRAIAAHILSGKPSAAQLFGLCRLTWITRSFAGEEAAYIASTKLPALSDAMGENFKGMELGEVATQVARKLNRPELDELICSHTGFTNFYSAYRNSARVWFQENRDRLLEICQRAYRLETDEEGAAVSELIAGLPLVPKADRDDQGMQPEFVVTPLCFALDPRVRFPILNGAARVRSVLKQAGVSDGSPTDKYRAMVRLIGENGIKDAADLDQLGLKDLFSVASSDHPAARALLQELPEDGAELPLKDDSEVQRLQQALAMTQRRLHNRMTNTLRRLLSRFTLFEGRADDCRFDVLVRKFSADGGDLLIEVKSSTDISEVRMAIGQVYSYWHRLNRDSETRRVALLLPNRPSPAVEDLLKWLDIGLLWLHDDQLETCTEWLDPVAVLRW